MIYIIYNKTEVFDYILEGVHNQEDFRMINLNAECSFVQRAFRKLLPTSLVISSLVLGRSLRETLKKLNENDTLLLIDYTEKNLILTIDKIVPKKTKKYIWIWNPIKAEDVSAVKANLFFFKNKNYSLCTFDKKDALDYEFKLLNQFYKMKQFETREINEIYDFYFLGFAKDRSQEINDLKNKLVNFKTFFHVVNETTELISYTKNIENIKKSKCIVDLVQKNQKGMSLRPLEAIAFRKKLITNNRSIIAEYLYNSQNIFIIGVDDFKGLNTFLNSDFVDLNESVISKYDVNNWLNNFKK